MRIAPDCFVCNQRQALEAARSATASDELTWKIMRSVGQAMVDLTETVTPAEATSIVHRIVRQMTGVADPYREAKARHSAVAVELYPALRALVERAENRLFTALKIAVVGNLLDLGVYSDIASIREQIWTFLAQDFAINDFASFASDVAQARRVLFIGDNAGEIGFDRLLIEEIGPERITFVVREFPVLNDATYQDAVDVGLDQLTRVITTGDDSIGIVFARCSEAFLEAYRSADLIISKGQANFESLNDRPELIYLLLQAKCMAVSRILGVPPQSLILKKAGERTADVIS